MIEFKHTLRQLPRNPGFAMVAIATLALGIGATTALFSLAHAVLISPYPSTDHWPLNTHRCSP